MHVTTPAAWWDSRRPEIVEEFEREVLGRVPGNAPTVVWTVTRTASFMVGGQPVIGKQLTGHVDNASYPAIAVDIQMTLVVPTRPPGPAGAAAPVMMMFGSGALTESGNPTTEQLVAAGWGYVSLSPTSVQADNGAGLTRGRDRTREQGTAAPAGRLGRPAGLGMGRFAGTRLPGIGQGRRCEARRHRRRLALRQSRAGDDGLRPAVRGGAGGIVRRRRRQTASARLGRAGGKPHRRR